MPWIDELLARNAQTAYLRHYGSPRTIDELPVVSYDELAPWIERIRDGEEDVLFAGRPVAYERTSGSTGGAKLIPYSTEGLHDIQQRAIAPWIERVLSGLKGSVYLALSPATRAPESINGVPVGLPDSAYIGSFKSAVPLEVAAIRDVDEWRAETVKHLAAARDLEVISVWSPTFLLRLLDECDFHWPHLRLISCWASGTSKPYAEELMRRFPHARIEPKGLMSTECVVTVPGVGLNPYGFFEFEPVDDAYEVLATTSSGLYRYRTGDLVDAQLEFLGRRGIVSDLVGEKLTEAFVNRCLEHVPGFRYLAPSVIPSGVEGPGGAGGAPYSHPGSWTTLGMTEGALGMTAGYILYAEHPVDIETVETRLYENPQYAYARKLGQLARLRLMRDENLYEHYVQAQLARGTRLGDIKPMVLTL
jgi:GH3 auxin-responsive promoter